jgi:hypothetical protein
MAGILLTESYPDVPEPAENTLETGVVSRCPALTRVGEAWFDSSQGTTYGNGVRYQHEETPTIAKVAHKRPQY